MSRAHVDTQCPLQDKDKDKDKDKYKDNYKDKDKDRQHQNYWIKFDNSTDMLSF